MDGFDPYKVTFFTAVFLIVVSSIIAYIVHEPIIILFGIGAFVLDYFTRLRPEMQKVRGKSRKR